MKPELHPRPAEASMTLEQNTVFDPTGLFWVDFDKLKKANQLINTAGMSVMALGVESRRDFLPEIKDDLAELFTDAQHPELARAIESGFMYGGLLIGDSEQSAESSESQQSMYQGMIRPLFERAIREPSERMITENTTNLMFMLLRDAEVAMTGSDILAYSLAAAQDHISNLYFKVEHTDTQYLLRAQTLFYAGMLAGAVLRCDPEKLAEHRAHSSPILRGALHSVESVSAQIEMDRGDDVLKSIEYELAHRHEFLVASYKNGRKPGFIVGVNAGILQFGPNKKSLPIFINGVSTPDSMYDARDLDYIVFQNNPEDQNEPATITLRKDPNAALVAQIHGDLEGSIIAIGKNDRVVSVYNSVHPVYQAMSELIERETGVAQLHSVEHDELGLTLDQQRDRRIEKALAAGAISALLTAWSPELQSLITSGNIALTPSSVMQGLAVDALIVASFISMRRVHRSVSKGGSFARMQIHIGDDNTTAYLGN